MVYMVVEAEGAAPGAEKTMCIKDGMSSSLQNHMPEERKKLGLVLEQSPKTLICYKPTCVCMAAAGCCYSLIKWLC